MMVEINLKSVDPPDLLVDKHADQVDEPDEGSTGENGQNAKHDAEHIFLNKASADTVNAPNDAERGNAKNELYKPRQVVNCFDKFFHNKGSFM
jgi:hypothetical protein